MSQINSPQTSVLFPPLSQDSNGVGSIPTLPVFKTADLHPTSPAISTLHPNQMRNVFSMAKLVVSITAIVSAVLIGGGFVVAQFATQARSLQRPEQNQQDIDYSKLVVPNVAAPPAPDSLADAPAIMHLDRAKRLAAIGRFKAAIASANNIQSSSPSYQAAQQSIEQWADQLLQLAKQLYADRQFNAAVEHAQAIPPSSKAFSSAQSLLQQWQEQRQIEQNNNQQYLQMAQQALAEGDGQTAMQNAAQITDDPRLRVQKAVIMQQAAPWKHLQKANQLMEQGEPENAIDEAARLPIAAPWFERKNLLIEAATRMIEEKAADERRRELCQNITLGLLSGCPQLAHSLDSFNQSPSNPLRSSLSKH